MKYKLSAYYKGYPNAPTPLWVNVVMTPVLIVLWLLSYPPTREDMYK